MNTRELGQVEHRGHQMNIPLRRPSAPHERPAGREREPGQPHRGGTLRLQASGPPAASLEEPDEARTIRGRDLSGVVASTAVKQRDRIGKPSNVDDVVQNACLKIGKATSSIASPWPHPPRVQNRDPFPGARQRERRIDVL